VDGLEQKLTPHVRVIRLDLLSPVGRTAARTYGVWLIPGLILFDGTGREISRQLGLLNPKAIIDSLGALH